MAALTPSPRGRIDNSVLPAGLLLHPFEVAVAVLAVVTGMNLVMAELAPNAEDITLVQRVMPFPISLVWGLFLAFGGLMTLIGVFTRSLRRWSLPLEVAGLALGASAWSAYALIVSVSAERNAAVPIGTGIVLTLASLVRIYALYLATRVAVRESRRHPTEE